MCLIFYSGVLWDKIIASAVFKIHTKIMFMEPRIWVKHTKPLGTVGLRSKDEHKQRVNSNEKLTSKDKYTGRKESWEHG